MLAMFLWPVICIMCVGGMPELFSFCTRCLRALWLVNGRMLAFSVIILIKVANLLIPIGCDLNHFMPAGGVLSASASLVLFAM